MYESHCFSPLAGDSNSPKAYAQINTHKSTQLTIWGGGVGVCCRFKKNISLPPFTFFIGISCSEVTLLSEVNYLTQERSWCFHIMRSSKRKDVTFQSKKEILDFTFLAGVSSSTLHQFLQSYPKLSSEWVR